MVLGTLVSTENLTGRTGILDLCDLNFYERAVNVRGECTCWDFHGDSDYDVEAHHLVSYVLRTHS